jgi:hypothetical protein
LFSPFGLLLSSVRSAPKVRIPLGYWIVEDTVDQASEHFPTGGFQYLCKVSSWAAEAGLSVILVLHGAPGAQVAEQLFTGQLAPTAGFYETYNYERAYKWFTISRPRFTPTWRLSLLCLPLKR